MEELYPLTLDGGLERNRSTKSRFSRQSRKSTPRSDKIRFNSVTDNDEYSDEEEEGEDDDEEDEEEAEGLLWPFTKLGTVANDTVDHGKSKRLQLPTSSFMIELQGGRFGRMESCCFN